TGPATISRRPCSSAFFTPAFRLSSASGSPSRQQGCTARLHPDTSGVSTHLEVRRADSTAWRNTLPIAEPECRIRAPGLLRTRAYPRRSPLITAPSLPGAADYLGDACEVEPHGARGLQEPGWQRRELAGSSLAELPVGASCWARQRSSRQARPGSTMA